MKVHFMFMAKKLFVTSVICMEYPAIFDETFIQKLKTEVTCTYKTVNSCTG